MKGAIRWAASLYPAQWRNRYGAEFAALLDDLRPGLRDFFNILQGAVLMQMKYSSAAKILATVGLAGLALAGWFAIRRPDRFVSTAVVQFKADNPQAGLEPIKPVLQGAFSRSSLAKVIQKESLYQDERRTDPLEDIVMRMRRNINVRRLAQQPSAFSVSFEYPDRYKAQKVNQDLTSMFLEQNLATRPAMTLAVLDIASLPTEPVAPRRGLILIMGFVGGLLVGILLSACATVRWSRHADSLPPD